MKRLFAFLVCALCAFMLFACDKPSENGGNNGEGSEGNGGTPSGSETLDKALDAKYKGIAKDKNIYLTTIGQGEIETIELFFDDLDLVAGTDYVKKNTLTADEVEEGSVVFIVVGTSSKGLGAAGVKLNQEVDRANAFAEKEGVTLLVFHVGGTARRGDMSDPIIDIICPKADLLLVVNSGNADGKFTNIAKDNNVDLYLFSVTAKLSPAINALFDK